MGSLIKNELIKVTKKKSVLIVLIIFLIYIVFTNIMVRFFSKFQTYDFKTDAKYIETARQELKNIDPKTNPEEYINYKTEIDFFDLYNKYEKNSWQQYIIERDFYDYLYNVNIAEYGTSAQKMALEGNPVEILNEQIEKINKGDWQSYVNVEIDSVNSELESVKIQYEELKNSNENIEKSKIQEIEKTIKTLENKKSLLQYRIDNEIPYGTNFMNDAIVYLDASSGLDYDYNKKEFSYEDKVNTQSAIQQAERAKYILKNKVDLENSSNLRKILMEIFEGYAIFIIVFIAITAGTIVSSEFEKGTIKILLIKPFVRSKILISKYVVAIIMMLFILLFTLLAQLLIGGIILGFDSLSVPVVEYSFDTNSLVSYNIFKYVLIHGLHQLPMFILITTLAFTASTVFSNSAIAIIIPIIGNIAGGIINQLAISLQIKQLAFLPTLNWDLSIFMFGKLPPYQYTNFGFALGISIVYWAALMIISIISFNKKQIKNI